MIDHLAEWVVNGPTEKELSNDDLLEKIVQMSQYIARLEAAYLQLYRESVRGSGPDLEAIKGRMARESLERIKAGDAR